MAFPAAGWVCAWAPAGIKNNSTLLEPGSGQPYQANVTLSYKSLAAIERPAETAAFWEANPAEDGRRGVAFVDGHVKRVPEGEWPQILKASTLPLTVPAKPKPAPPARKPPPRRTRAAPRR